MCLNFKMLLKRQKLIWIFIESVFNRVKLIYFFKFYKYVKKKNLKNELLTGPVYPIIEIVYFEISSGNEILSIVRHFWIIHT